MKKIIIPVLALFFLSACSHDTPQTTEQKEVINDNKAMEIELTKGKYNINKEESKISWMGRKIVGNSHTGTIDIDRASLDVTENISGEIVIDMNTINSDEKLDKLETHLASSDFFDVSKFPESKLEIKTLELSNNNQARLKGTLTIKGISNEIDINAKTEIKEKSIKIMSKFDIDRTKWDVQYGSDKFFDNLKDNIIDDMIEYEISLHFDLE